MGIQVLLLSFLPLLLFVIIDAKWGFKNGLIGAIIGAITEVVISLVFFGEIDFVSWISIALIFVLGGISLWKKDSLTFKFQPVILGLSFGFILLISYYMGHPLMLEFAQKYQEVLPLQVRGLLGNPVFKEYLKICSHLMGYGLILHAGAIAWAAVKLSNWWWLIIRFGGLYFTIFLVVMISQQIVGNFFN